MDDGACRTPVGGGPSGPFGDLLLAQIEHCLRLEETKHIDRLYVPRPT
jgi:hypothetical protein